MTEALALDPHPKGARIIHDRPPMLAIGVMIWLGSELMFFSGLFAAFFTIRAQDHPWPPVGTHLDVIRAGIFTAILVSSSFTMQYAVWCEEHYNRGRAKLFIVFSMVLGAAFLANQGAEWATLTTRPGTNAYGSLFFIMSGLHGLHVFLGLVAMIFLLARMKGPAGDPGELSVFQGVSYYWHFVDVVWVGLYSCLFLLK